VDPTGRKGRRRVWNSRRGNHLGQRSYASAPKGQNIENLMELIRIHKDNPELLKR
jgi:hypothetical protein